MTGVESDSLSPVKEDAGTSLESVEPAAQVAAYEAISAEDEPAGTLQTDTTGGDGMGNLPRAASPGSSAAPTMSLLRMEEKFSSGQYRAIGDFVSDFRTMLEGCYQLHGADHWLSKQAQKLELMLEQKLSVLSRNLREKTSAAVTPISCGRPEEDIGCTSTRRRSSARQLASVNSGAMESVMVQILKQAEFLRAKEEKRIKEQEKKEAEEANLKEMDEWDRGLLALTAPSSMETMWEIPAIGHFLCLAQQILNLPEIVFYELERCLLMPQCNVFLAKIMTSLLSPPHSRLTLHRRPNLPYRAWETALRQKVQQWYTVIGQAEKPDRCAEKLGLCPQFFKALGEVNPLEHKTFHELTFYQKVWLLKGLCDFVYETQSEVQDAVLGQPIHECREVILGYDTQENAYIHFPQFCGADVRVYKQRPFKAPEFPVPSVKIKRTPRIKLSRSKCKYSKKRNGILKNVKKVVSSTCSTNSEKYSDFKEESSANCHGSNCNNLSDSDMKPDCGHEDNHCHSCSMTVSCKENVEKPVGPGELLGYGEPLSPGEVRILENVDKYSETTLLKADTSPLKENALKTYQVHMNGYHTDNTEVICHRVAMDIILDHPLVNHKKLSLNKMRAKKKKNKKIKDLLNKSIQGKCENFQTHSIKSLKSEMFSKLYLNKKQAKQKKHKSGKKMVIMKRKVSAASPSSPEFQLVCTNLNELRELIKKIEGELKCMENNKKKSGKWHFRRQGVKELHSTLTRLLKELLPWEPKLQKAFQKNRARLRRDYDDFLKLTNSENLTREACNEECDTNKSPKSLSKTMVSCQKEMPEKGSPEKLVDSEIGTCGKTKMVRQDSSLKELPERSCKRLNRQYIYPYNEEKVTCQQKRIKLSTPEISGSSLDGRDRITCLESQWKNQLDAAEIRADIMCASPLDAVRGSKPIQALLAKNLGNKVTLTSQLAQSVKPISQNAQNLFPLQSALPCPNSLKPPLQMIYKLPDGHCVPVLQNSPVKIQVQPVVDTKTGEKLMQQVLLLPKNLIIQQKDEKLSRHDNHHAQPDVSGKIMKSAVSSSISSSVGYINAEKTAQLVTALNKSTVHSTTCSTAVVSQPTIPFACSSTASPCETSKSNTSILTANLPISMPPSVRSAPVHSDPGGVPPNTGRAVIANHIVNVSSAPQTDTSEAKQELKTECIRDSQSILVRTRGGNTGLVKVQPSQEQVTPVSNSLFTLTPQLQSFLVSRSKTSASSNVMPVPQSSILQSSSAFGDRSHLTEINTKSTPVTYPISRICKTTEKSVRSSNLVNSVHPVHWPTVSQATTNIAVNIPTCISGEQCGSAINKNTDLKQAESSLSVVQPDTTTSKGDLRSGSSLHKVLLITPPPILASPSAPTISMLTTSAVTPQKFVFINTQVPTSSSSTNVALQSSKLANPTIICKTYVKPAESPQIILIPSTMTSPIKTSSAPIVSQVKDVKIGLTIGQTIVNSTSGMKDVLPINILQKTLGKVVDNSNKDFAISSVDNFNLKGQNGQVASSNLVHTVPVTKTSATSTVMATAKQGTTLSSGIDLSKSLPPFFKSLCPSNGGSTVALSTVKTGHLSSSVLLSTQMTGQVKNALSSLQIPVTSPSLGESSHLKTPMTAAFLPVTKERMEKTQYISEMCPKILSTNATKPQVILNSPLTPTLCKSSSVDSPYQALPPFSSTTVTQLKSQLNDCTHQKLVINTSTPLVPGTRITINGTRLIVPPQGLGAGSHVLLLSTNAKQGLPLVGSSVQTCSNSLLNNTTVRQSLKQNVAPVPTSEQPLNMYSVAAPKLLPSVQNTTQYGNMTSRVVSPCPVSSVDRISTCPALTTVPQPRIVPCIPQGSYPQPSNVMQLPKSISVKEQIILSVGESSANLVPASENMTSSASFVNPSSSPEKQHTVAS